MVFENYDMKNLFPVDEFDEIDENHKLENFSFAQGLNKMPQKYERHLSFLICSGYLHPILLETLELFHVVVPGSASFATTK